MTEDQLRARNAQLDTFLTWFDGFVDALNANHACNPVPNSKQWEVLQREIHILATPQARPDFLSEYVKDKDA